MKLIEDLFDDIENPEGFVISQWLETFKAKPLGKVLYIMDSDRMEFDAIALSNLKRLMQETKTTTLSIVDFFYSCKGEKEIDFGGIKFLIGVSISILSESDVIIKNLNITSKGIAFYINDADNVTFKNCKFTIAEMYYENVVPHIDKSSKINISKLGLKYWDKWNLITKIEFNNIVMGRDNNLEKRLKDLGLLASADTIHIYFIKNNYMFEIETEGNKIRDLKINYI